MKTTKMAACAILSLLMAACALPYPYDSEENLAVEEYTQTFIKTFGLIDQNQDWNMATRVSADISLGYKYAPLSHSLTLRIFTSRPGESECRLVARSIAPQGGKVSMSFDFLKGASRAYVTLTDADRNYLYYGYLPIIDGKIEADLSNPESRADAAVIKTSESRKREDHYSWFTYNNGNLVNFFGTNPDTYAHIYNVFHLSGNEIAAPVEQASYLERIVGIGKPFAERGVTDGKCNLQYWFGAQNDVVLKTTAAGEISVDLLFANTDKRHQLGYLYYSQAEGDAAEAESAAGTGATDAMRRILTKDRYIIFDDASYRVFSMDGNPLNSYQDFNTISYGQNLNKSIVGESCHLVYYGPDGTSPGSYIFPADTHIVFFMAMDAASENEFFHDMNIRYSRVIFNKMFVNRGPWPACSVDGPNKCPEVLSNAISFVWDGKILLGFEDEVDDDMNDLLLNINGNFSRKSLVSFEEGERVDPQEPDDSDDTDDSNLPPDDIDFDAASINWILACEDLGAIGDFDFNDIVFGISYVEDENATERVIRVYPLASGGTIPAYLLFNGQQVGDEIHSMLGVPTGTPYNTSGAFRKPSAYIDIKLPDGQEFTLAQGQTVSNQNMGGFSLRVEGRGDITAPGLGEAPQMICVPGTWRWPSEYTNILSAYPGFGVWGSNYGISDWYSAFDSGKVMYWY